MPYKDPEIRKAKGRIYTAEHRKRLTPAQLEQRKAQQRDHKKQWWASLSPEDKTLVIAKKRRKYATDPNTRNRRHLDAKMRYNELRKLVLKKLGNRCSSPTCRWINFDGTRGCTDPRCLQIDHVDGGGTKEFRSMSAYAFLKKVLESVLGYQILCANCNWIKRRENKEYSKGRPITPVVIEHPVVPLTQ